MIRKVFIFTVISLFIGGCSTNGSLKKGPYGAYGEVWCPEPFIRDQKTPFDETHLHVAENGYIYALAGALVLQKETPEDKAHYFHSPSHLVKVHAPARHSSGFEVATFKLYSVDNTTGNASELVIAFTGSNDSADWISTNLLFSKTQYDLAREYVKKMHKKYPNLPITVTGYSLGGGLAVHVTKNAETSSLIDKTWAFNPSPKIYAHGDTDHRIWVAAVRGEALHTMRSWFWRFWPGVSNIGSPSNQTATDYYLVKANPVYGHFRWVLARNMLHAADYSIYKRDHKSNNEPLAILRESHFDACSKN